MVAILLATPFLAAPPANPAFNGEWLIVFTAQPEAVVYRHGAYTDAAAHISLRNQLDDAVRVTGVRFEYFSGERLLRTDSAGPSFFADDFVERTDRIEQGVETSWPGICLSEPPVGADGVRIQLDLSARRGLRAVRSLQGVQVSLREVSPAAVLVLPFRGFWRVTQGHTCRTNHRIGGYGADFAWDFVALDPRTGSSLQEAYPLTRKNRDTVSFGKPILAPADGRVVRVVDDVADNEGLRELPGRSLLDEMARPLRILGNYVVVDLGDGRWLLLAHLRRGSVTVKSGQVIRAEERIAECGNSGNSVEPHVHVQVMDRADPSDPSVRGLPSVFRDYIEFRSETRHGRRDSLVRRVERGDPLEGSVISAAGESAPPSPAPADERVPDR